MRRFVWVLAVALLSWSLCETPGAHCDWCTWCVLGACTSTPLLLFAQVRRAAGNFFADHRCVSYYSSGNCAQLASDNSVRRHCCVVLIVAGASLHRAYFAVWLYFWGQECGDPSVAAGPHSCVHVRLAVLLLPGAGGDGLAQHGLRAVCDGSRHRQLRRQHAGVRLGLPAGRV